MSRVNRRLSCEQSGRPRRLYLTSSIAALSAVASATLAFAQIPGAPLDMCTDKTGPCNDVVPLFNPSDYDAAHYANSPALAKFVDKLPTIPVAKAETLTINGEVSDYYQIAVEGYAQKMHGSLPPTKLRGYKQVGPTSVAQATPNYFGPMIIAERNRPVRLTFTNNLTGKPLVPVDETVMGAGMGPPINKATGKNCSVSDYGVSDLNGPLCTVPGRYSQNRSLLHLHGGFTPWISDGTAHQWVTPAGDSSQYKKGVSYRDVPDMQSTTPTDGTATYYYPNQQSSRMMWYHDHTYGLTRLNVYSGQAAPFLLTDAPEAALMTAIGVTPQLPPATGPNPAVTLVNAAKRAALGVITATGTPLGLPLVIQDKTFVTTTTNSNQTATTTTDPRWADLTNPASPDPSAIDPAVANEGSLWFPHVYVPNKIDEFGLNPKGRWDFGPFVAPAAQIRNEKLPTTSIVPEAFMDTMVVNGNAYPYANVPQQAVRLRLLNASNDRYVNLQLYYAVTGSGTMIQPRGAPAQRRCTTIDDRRPARGSTVQNCTEVKMIRALGTTLAGGAHRVPAITVNRQIAWPAFDTYTPFDNRDGGVPDPLFQGPPMIQIGNEGGFLPAPVVHRMQAIDYEYDRKQVNALNVRNNPVDNPPGCSGCKFPTSGYTVYIGPGERADVLVDFSLVPDGATLILYNDAPAPLPGIDPRYDLFTGMTDHDSTGGARTPQQGFGPNNRTVMQFRVDKTLGSKAPLITSAWVKNTLEPALATAYAASHTDAVDSGLANKGTVDPPINVAECDMTKSGSCASTRLCDINPAVNPLGSTCRNGLQEFPTCEAAKTLLKLPNGQFDNAKDPGYRKTCGFAVRNKSIAEDFEPIFGRLNAKLGTEQAAGNTQGQNTFGFNYADPTTETLKEGETEIWNIVHNGVDSHTVHWHLFNVQIVNRVDWAGTIKPIDPNERGWKDTIRVHPLENTVVAVRANRPKLPASWGILPGSRRPMDVTSAIGTVNPSQFALFPFTPTPANASPVNTEEDFGWEYIWHCHLLGHEENDMMRPMVMQVDPTNLAVSQAAPAITPVVAPVTPAAGARQRRAGLAP
jgi:FtsP/CotA-like multicopper oxidase with cupredoxin domain